MEVLQAFPRSPGAGPPSAQCPPPFGEGWRRSLPAAFASLRRDRRDPFAHVPDLDRDDHGDYGEMACLESDDHLDLDTVIALARDLVEYAASIDWASEIRKMSFRPEMIGRRGGTTHGDRCAA